MRNSNVLIASALLMMAAMPAAAQANAAPATGGGQPAPADTTAAKGESALAQQITIQHFRAYDQRGLNVFEAPKNDNVPFEGFRLAWGAAFTQQFQDLSHSNTAAPKAAKDATGNAYDANQLKDIGAGFNNAAANLYLNAQLARGVRVALETYLSSRHHEEAWVKDGYLLIDASPIKSQALDNIMQYVTLKVGHFEINYGDAHFRRTDNGNAMYNPFVGNYIMDAFTTEIGAEAYVRAHGFMAMAGVTGGEIHGEVTNPGKRAPAFLGKVGFDRQLTPDLRVRLTASGITQERALGNTLYGGDRAGSRYFYVMENTVATVDAQAWSGLINPGFRSRVNAYMVNPFVKYQGVELFGLAEHSKGRASNETTDRTWTQYAVDGVYRFLPGEKLFVGARYNTANGTLAGITPKVSVNRTEVGGGWFVTPTVMAKAEYVTQRYDDFPTTDIRSGGKFHGMMIEGTVAF